MKSPFTSYIQALEQVDLRIDAYTCRQPFKTAMRIGLGALVMLTWLTTILLAFFVAATIGKPAVALLSIFLAILGIGLAFRLGEIEANAKLSPLASYCTTYSVGCLTASAITGMTMSYPIMLIASAILTAISAPYMIGYLKSQPVKPIYEMRPTA